MTTPLPKTDIVAVLTGAGSGSRLGSHGPKALVELGGRPLVWWAAHSLTQAGCHHIIVTAPTDALSAFREALADLPGISVVAGSSVSRQASVALGLAELGDRAGETVVLVHDAARPLTPVDAIRRVIDAVRAGEGAVIPVVPVVDTLKSVDGEGIVNGTPDRSHMVAVQTPQGFRLSVLQRAHEAGAARADNEEGAATDDAGLVEALGGRVATVAGDERSLKITRPLDLSLARLLMHP